MGFISEWLHRRKVRTAQGATKAELELCLDIFRKDSKNPRVAGLLSPLSIPAMRLVLVHHLDPVVRALAARTLAEAKSEGVEGSLSQALTDPAPAVRQSAIAGLAKLARGDFTKQLIPAMKDGDETVRAAAAAGLSVGGREGMPHLLVALSDPTWSVRASAVRSLEAQAGFAEAEAVDAILLLAQTEEMDPTRRSAACALAKMFAAPVGDYVLGKVTKVVNQPDAPKGMREVAADVLGRIGRQEGVAPLLSALSDPEPQVRDKALESLGRLGKFADPGMADEIIRILRTERDDHIRRTALGALIKLRESPVAGHVGERLTQLVFQAGESDDARAAATLALAEVAGAGSLTALESLTGNASARVRAAAAWGLGEIKGERSVTALRRLASDKDAGVKEAALSGLKKNDIPLCRRCGAVAERLFGFTKEPVCLTCYSKPGVCQSCGKNVGSDSNLIKISAGKNCRECDARLDQMVTGGFRSSTRIR